MIQITILLLLILFVSLNIGGGLYETLVVYPNWKKDITPDNLVSKLKSSGQWLANGRFWPLVSPLQGLLALVNLVMAWRYNGEAHGFWLAAALLVLAGRIATFIFFVPPMLKVFMKPENTDPVVLQRKVRRWTMLSPVRIPVEMLAWGLAMWAFHLM